MTFYFARNDGTTIESYSFHPGVREGFTEISQNDFENLLEALSNVHSEAEISDWRKEVQSKVS